MLEAFSESNAQVGVRFLARVFLMHGCRANFHGESCVRVLDQVITRQRRNRETVIEIGNPIVQEIQTKADVESLSDQMIVLGESRNKLGVGAVGSGSVVVVLPIAASDPQCKFVFLPFATGI